MTGGTGDSRPAVSGAARPAGESETVVLIVDDEVHAIEGLRRGVAWESLGVSRLLSARNIRQAKKILLQEAVDIVVCDIEMPQGSGLDLVSWMNASRPGIDAVFLTCHAEFDYARKAVRLGSFDYLLKPVPYRDLERVLRRLIERRRHGRKDREYLEAGMRWEREKSRLAESYWAAVITGRIQGDSRTIAARAGEYETAVDASVTCVPVLLAVPPRRKDCGPGDEAGCRAEVRACVEEICASGGLPVQTVPHESGSLAAIHLVPPGSPALVPEALWESCRSSCRERAGCEVQCFIGLPGTLADLAGSVDALANLAANSFACRDGIVRLDRRPPAGSEPAWPDMSNWPLVLQGGGAAKVRAETVEFLEGLSRRGGCDARTVYRFHEDFSQAVHAALKLMRIPARELCPDDGAFALAWRAATTLPDLIAWVDGTLARFESLRESRESSRSAVQTARRYIENHLAGEITCAEIAAHVRLNPDYLSRVFRRVTGQSVHEYVIAAKMAMARDLLAKTSLPVSEIASRMGYSNFSHFAGAFKSRYGSTPSAFRASWAR
jgi:two-component system response regulator YesN